MSRHSTPALFLALCSCGATALAQAPQTVTSTAQAPRADGPRTDSVVLQALQANPLTAPYRITATLNNHGRLVLAGRVGTHQVHDAAIRTVLAVTATPIRDDLVIDTLEAHRVAAQGAMGPAGPGLRAGAPSLGTMPYTLGNMPYVYPPPLFGRLDDPFFGFEPPLLSYPPWWRGASYRMAALAPPMTGPINAGAGAGAPAGGLSPAAVEPAAGAPAAPAPGANIPAGAVEMTLNSQGVAVLRGTVPSLAARIAVGQEIARQPGINEVINLLDVNPAMAAAPATAAAAAAAAVPPPPLPGAPAPDVKPPDKPAAPAPAPAADKPAPGRALTVDAGDLTARITDAFARRPALAEQPIRVTVRDGLASLTGNVPTVYEAMIAFRALQQMPGIREVSDRLEFAMPDDEHRNPLVSKGRPEDVEPYLEAQLRRELSDLAHVDSVRLRGDTLDVRGNLAREEDRPRLDATLRSMPILRGFRVAPAFTVD